jgi:hypothetical protein
MNKPNANLFHVFHLHGGRTLVLQLLLLVRLLALQTQMQRSQCKRAATD